MENRLGRSLDLWRVSGLATTMAIVSEESMERSLEMTTVRPRRLWMVYYWGTDSALRYARLRGCATELSKDAEKENYLGKSWGLSRVIGLGLSRDSSRETGRVNCLGRSLGLLRASGLGLSRDSSMETETENR